MGIQHRQKRSVCVCGANTLAVGRVYDMPRWNWMATMNASGQSLFLISIALQRPTTIPFERNAHTDRQLEAHINIKHTHTHTRSELFCLAECLSVRAWKRGHRMGYWDKTTRRAECTKATIWPCPMEYAAYPSHQSAQTPEWALYRAPSQNSIQGIQRQT